LAAECYDVAISRFGTMFFPDPAAAFANIAAARAEQRLHETLAAHLRGDDGVVFDSRAWIVSARRG
jgi:hypothetical protein